MQKRLADVVQQQLRRMRLTAGVRRGDKFNTELLEWAQRIEMLTNSTGSVQQWCESNHGQTVHILRIGWRTAAGFSPEPREIDALQPHHGLGDHGTGEFEHIASDGNTLVAATDTTVLIAAVT